MQRISQIQKLLQNNPQDNFLLFALAMEHAKQNNLELAIHTLENLRKINANYLGLYFHLGGFYAKNDNLIQAIEIFNLGIDIAHQQSDFHSLRELKSAKINLEIQ